MFEHFWQVTHGREFLITTQCGLTPILRFFFGRGGAFPESGRKGRFVTEEKVRKIYLQQLISMSNTCSALEKMLEQLKKDIFIAEEMYHNWIEQEQIAESDEML